MTDEQFDAVNTKRVEVIGKGKLTTVHAYGTVFYSRDLSRSRGWIVKGTDGYVLCFNSPEIVVAPNEALAAAASPAIFKYEIDHLPEGSVLTFNESCGAGR